MSATTPPAGHATLRVTGALLSILAALLLGFVAQMTAFGGLQHARAQRIEYADFRGTLAQAKAPVGQVDDGGKLLTLGTPVAVLDIPRIGLHEVVGEGTTAGVLAAGPGHRRDSVLPGQPGTSVLLGRRAGYGGPFARIGSLRRGDAITVVTGQGKHTFTVLKVRRHGDPLPPALAAGQGRLTLITADGPAYVPAEVLRVDASLTSGTQSAPRAVIGAGALPRAEQAMGFDQGVLISLVLWGQLLVAAAFAVVWIHHRVGRWHAWVIAIPVLGFLGLTVADQASSLLPNLL
jgi:LPXTG-site transpeptidase (sortase) family protein